MKHPDLEYGSPNRFRFKERVLLSLSSLAISSALKSILLTCRIETRNSAIQQQMLAEHKCFLAAFWHEHMILSLLCNRNSGFHTLTSYSFDGELAARVAHRFGVHALRGSSSRGGRDALVNLEKAIAVAGGVGLTVDGPRGPRHQAKAGIAMLSARTRVPIVPIAYTAHRQWRMNSWDKTVLPKPFSKIVGMLGQPIPPPEDHSREAIEATRGQIERALQTLQTKLEEDAILGHAVDV